MLGVGAIPGFILTISAPSRVLNNEKLAPFFQLVNIRTPEELILFGAIGLTVVFVTKGLISSLMNYLKFKYIFTSFKDLSVRLHAAYMQSPYEFYINQNMAHLIRNVNFETYSIVHNVLLPFIMMISNVFMVLFVFCLLFSIQPYLSFLAICILGSVGLIFLKFFNKKIKLYGKSELHHRSIGQQIVLQSLSGFKDCRVTGTESFFIDSYNESLSERIKAMTFRNAMGTFINPVIEITAVVSILGISLWLTNNGKSFEETIAILSLFALATMRLLPAMKQLVDLYTKIRFNVYSLPPVKKDLEFLTHISENSCVKKTLFKLKKELQIKNLSFKYEDGEKLALEDINLIIPHKKAVAFVGESGAGKTSIVHCILGLLQWQKGLITVDGKDILSDIRSWRNSIGYVSQNMFIANDTVLRNVAFGMDNSKIDVGCFWKAVEAAQLKEFILDLPQQENTIVGERGTKLSGGQQQRIAIARSLYHNPQILVLDEATSALDNLTEKYVVEAIDKLKGDITIIMVAHRLSTVKNCDTIYFMKSGKIDAFGTYEELLQSNNTFRHMALEAEKATHGTKVTTY